MSEEELTNLLRSLLPCPFCGSDAYIAEDDFDGSPCTGCTNQRCRLGAENFSMAPEDWNARLNAPRPLEGEEGWKRNIQRVRG